MTLYGYTVGFYALMASLVMGASVFEALVVHPAWSRTPPESFVAFGRNAVSRMNFALFWAPVAGLYALSGIASVAAAYSSGVVNKCLMISAACAVAAVAWTLVYFRPVVTRFLEHGGGTAPAEQLRAAVRRWITLNLLRVTLVIASWGCLFIAITGS